MNRRGFLGSIIGSVLSSSFLALTDKEPWQRVKLPWRMMWRTNEGYIQAPAVESVEFIGRAATWIPEPLMVNHTMMVRGIVLLDERGNYLRESRFSTDVPMTVGDKLHCHFALETGYAFQSLDELVEQARKEPNIVILGDAHDNYFPRRMNVPYHVEATR